MPMWPRFINIVLGLWLMAAPAVLGYENAAANNSYIVGPLLATFDCIAIWEVVRPARWANLPLGLWLAASPLVLSYPTSGAANVVLVGMAAAILAYLGGKVKQRFAGGWSSLWQNGANEPSA